MKKESVVQSFLLAIVTSPLACFVAVYLGGVPELSQLLARGMGMFLFEWVTFFALFAYFSREEEANPQFSEVEEPEPQS